MSESEIVRAEPHEVDGFAGYTDAVVGQGRTRPQGAPILKFNNDSTWTIYDEPVPADREFVIVDITRAAVRWPADLDGGGPVEVITLRANEPFPDIEQMNANTAKSEWRMDPSGNLRGPWQAQHTAHLLDPKSMDRANYPTSTIGGAICMREVVSKTQWMRKLRGQETIFPVITLADTFMPTRFGGRQRPHFNIVRFVTFGGPGTPAATIEDPVEAMKLLKPQTVAPPRAKEATGDSIPF